MSQIAGDPAVIAFKPAKAIIKTKKTLNKNSKSHAIIFPIENLQGFPITQYHTQNITLKFSCKHPSLSAIITA